jgi:hypothetical protein
MIERSYDSGVHVVLIIQVFFSVLCFSPEHSEAVISCMETIMKLVIEESENVQPQIASCLLENVKKEKVCSYKLTSVSNVDTSIAKGNG